MPAWFDDTCPLLYDRCHGPLLYDRCLGRQVCWESCLTLLYVSIACCHFGRSGYRCLEMLHPCKPLALIRATLACSTPRRSGASWYLRQQGPRRAARAPGYHSRRCQYLFGKAQRPACVQCRNDTLWAHMCMYQSNGPVCPRADQERLTREFVDRCAASPGYTLAQLRYQRRVITLPVQWSCITLLCAGVAQACVLLCCALLCMSLLQADPFAPAYRNKLVCRAENGSASARELLQMTPCDVFPYLRGRTTWLVGDSMQQAGLPVACKT